MMKTTRDTLSEMVIELAEQTNVSLSTVLDGAASFTASMTASQYSPNATKPLAAIPLLTFCRYVHSHAQYVLLVGCDIPSARALYLRLLHLLKQVVAHLGGGEVVSTGGGGDRDIFADYDDLESTVSPTSHNPKSTSQYPTSCPCPALLSAVQCLAGRIDTMCDALQQM
eukprot:TRINITY_DN15782_c0_g1_i1.p1 TRINITY_DN15782_c0_g1~~TRINITY_DN15782_c0_g1_i1.p1  ORF type:complete len:169 (-),score=7.47 TRINITY_DN15782_c0_g1_i1:51-557(-)